MFRVTSGLEVGVTDSVFHAVCLNCCVADHGNARSTVFHLEGIAQLHPIHDIMGQCRLRTECPEVIFVLILIVVYVSCSQTKRIAQAPERALYLAKRIDIILTQLGQGESIARIIIFCEFVAIVYSGRYRKWFQAVFVNYFRQSRKRLAFNVITVRRSFIIVITAPRGDKCTNSICRNRLPWSELAEEVQIEDR